MSTMPANTGAAALDDLRDRVGAAAARRSAQNRPRHLVILALLLLLVSAITLVLAYRSRQTAMEELDTERARARRVDEIVRELGELKARSSNGQPQFGQPLATVRSRIETAATRAGLRDPLPVPRTNTDTNVGGRTQVQRVRFTYDVKDPSLDALLQWVTFSMEDVPDLDVYSLKLNPMTTQGVWSLNIVFSRWERTSS